MAKRTAHPKSHIASAESWALVAPEADESRLDRFIERGVRLPADYRPEACVFHAERNAPQVTHFEHLAERRDKRRTQHEQPPWGGGYYRLSARFPSYHSADRLRHLRSVLVKVGFHMKDRERCQRVAPGEQFDDRACDVRKVRPLMSYAAGAGIADLPDALTGFDQTLREPVVAGRNGPKEV